jgi:ApbE superfamily uncharacterized protein (UPF0280 family)
MKKEQPAGQKIIRYHFEFRQTIATILALEPAHIWAATDGIIRARQELEDYIAGDRFFATTFDPYPVTRAPLLVKRMSEAGIEAGVGPMAAVAGAIAWAGLESMRDAGAGFGVVDNGGDIALLSDRELKIGLFAGDSPFSGRYAFRVPPQEKILGICTSSATVGPSVSFGMADAVTVFSEDVARADAWATSICNQVTPDDREVFFRLDPTKVRGVMVVAGDWTTKWGVVPELIPARVEKGLITAGLGPYFS